MFLVFQGRLNSKINANVIMDSDSYEELEPISVKEFPSGRGILSVEGINNNKAMLVQIPYIEKDVIKGYIKSLATHKENR